MGPSTLSSRSRLALRSSVGGAARKAVSGFSASLSKPSTCLDGLMTDGTVAFPGSPIGDSPRRVTSGRRVASSDDIENVSIVTDREVKFYDNKVSYVRELVV
jgi:hypothetical protein